MKWGQKDFVPTNPDLAHILGNTDFDFENYHCLYLLDPKPVLAMEREARRKLKLCFINVLELANTHQQRYSRTAEIASTP